MDNEIIRDAQTVSDSERIEKLEALYKEQRKTNKIKRGAFLTAFSVILGLILSKIFGLLLSLINQYYTEIGNKEVTDFILSEEGSLLINVFYSFFLAGIPFLFGFLISKQSLNETFLFKKTKPGVTAAFVAVGLGVSMLANIVTALFGEFFSFLDIPIKANAVVASKGFSGIFLNVFAVGIIPALIEEFACRGVIIGIIRRHSSKSAAIFVSAILFGAMHGNFRQIPFAFLLGLILGYAYAKTENLLVPILIHFFNNTFSILLDEAYMRVGVIEQSILSAAYFTVCLIASLIGFVYLIKNEPDFLKLEENDGVEDIKKSVSKTLSAVPMVLALVLLLLNALYYQFSNEISHFFSEVLK